MPRWWFLLLLVMLSGCSGTTRKVVRLDTGQSEPFVLVLRSDVEPVALEEGEFKQAIAAEARHVPHAERPLEFARQKFEVPDRSGWYQYEGQSRRLLPAEAERQTKLEILPADAELIRQYLLWCGRTWGSGDCLRLLENGPLLDSDDKYVLSMAIAQGSVLAEMKEALGEMVDPLAVVAMVSSAVTMYAVLLALPEPISKAIAVTMTIAATAYLGVDTMWRLIVGWRVLMEEVDRATRFEQIQASGEKYGGVMGSTAARAFVMLATVAVGNTAAGMAAKLPTLPGAGQAVVMAEAQLGIRYGPRAMAHVESVALTAEGITITLASNAVAMTAQQPPPQQGFAAQETIEATGQLHHVISKAIATKLKLHPTLQGLYKERDPRFVTRAKDKEAHNGYQRWHRNVDKDVVRWLDDHLDATPEEFEHYLREVYSRPEMIERFPNGF